MPKFIKTRPNPNGKFANFDERINAPIDRSGKESQTPPNHGGGNESCSATPKPSGISTEQAKQGIAAYRMKQHAEAIGKAAGKAAVAKIMAEERANKVEREKREASDAVWATAMKTGPAITQSPQSESVSSPVSATDDIWDQARAANEAQS